MHKSLWWVCTGKSVGVVTTARVTHASPAASYAHSPDRNWERDSDMKDLPDKCVPDIATQLIKNNSNINVSLASCLSRPTKKPRTGVSDACLPDRHSQLTWPSFLFRARPPPSGRIMSLLKAAFVNGNQRTLCGKHERTRQSHNEPWHHKCPKEHYVRTLPKADS